MSSDGAPPAPKRKHRSGQLERRGAVTESRLDVRGGEARLVMLEGPARGRKFSVEDGMTFGRGRAASVFLDAADISREHARIRFDGHHLIEDLGSRNGTFINGVPIDGPTRLAFGDRVGIGAQTILLFTRVDPAEEELRQRQRLGLLGRITAGVAHDVNNLLGVIMSTQDFLLGTEPTTQLGDDETRECLLEVRAAAERAAQLMPKLLSFARGQSDGYGPFDLSAVCNEVAHVVQRTFDRRIVVETEITPDLTVAGDRVEIHQVIMNLCVNARDAMPEGGTLRLTASFESTKVRGQRVARIEVTDTGEGMTPEIQSRVFEPFFTTKARGKGSGLGLATAKEMLDMHGGCITVRSQKGSGTTFRVDLPLDSGGHRVATMTCAPTFAPGGAPGTILLVDDDPMCRKAFARILRRAGHHVTAVESGGEALERMAHGGRRPDLILLDVDMPLMSGEETQRRLREVDPTVRIVAITGNRSPERQQAMLDGGVLDLVPKPFTQSRLIAAVQAALLVPVRGGDPSATYPGDGPLTRGAPRRALADR